MIAAVLGAVFGSFLNVVAYRLPRGESLSRPALALPALRDADPAVRQRPGAVVAAAARPLPVVPGPDLAALSARRGGHGLLCALVVVAKGADADALLGLALVLLLVPITLIDLDHRIIPNRLTLIGAIIAPLLVAFTDPGALPEHLIAGVAAGGFFLIALLAYPSGMGMGDVKLAAVLGLFLGRAVGPAIFIALVAGTLVGALVIARKGTREGRKTAVPFGPFLALGGVVALFAGDAMVDWYLGTFA